MGVWLEGGEEKKLMEFRCLLSEHTKTLSPQFEEKIEKRIVVVVKLLNYPSSRVLIVSYFLFSSCAWHWISDTLIASISFLFFSSSFFFFFCLVLLFFSFLGFTWTWLSLFSFFFFLLFFFCTRHIFYFLTNWVNFFFFNLASFSILSFFPQLNKKNFPPTHPNTNKGN